MFGYKPLDILTASVVAVVFVITLNIVGTLVLEPHEQVAAVTESSGEGESQAASGGEQTVAASEVSAAAGEKVFKKCKACHDNAEDGKHKTGPNLHGIIGRAAGSADGFNYSDAMKGGGLTWDAKTLDAFLADPKGTVNGTKMAFNGISKAEDRASLIAYLGGDVSALTGGAGGEEAKAEEKPAEQPAEEAKTEEQPAEQQAATGGGDAAAGENVFKKCKACHTVDAGGKNRTGPNLFGIVGRPAGSVDGFKYSDAMKNSGLTWDEETLHKFIADPKGFVDGTRMAFKGISKEEDLADLLAYLNTLK